MPIPIIAGPTASGKTAVAVELSKLIGGEIISCDSMQVYQHLSIGTAKPGSDELQGQQYHLIDHVAPNEQYHLGRFITEAQAKITEIRTRGRIPILCGGTGLYIKGLIYGIMEVGQAAPDIRKQLEDELTSKGLPALFLELQAIDPVSAARYGMGDRQRILRALEVFRSTSIPMSELQKQDLSRPTIKTEMYVLQRSRTDLYKAINSRVDAMVSRGLFDEVKSYIKMGWSKENPAFKALGYKEIASALAGEFSVQQALEMMKQKSRRYAKRQETWFRAMPGTRWIPADNLIASAIAETLSWEWKKSVDNL